MGFTQAGGGPFVGGTMTAWAVAIPSKLKRPTLKPALRTRSRLARHARLNKPVKIILR
jgi:hypothetical protein